MKLSAETKSILKNYAGISSNILISPGTKLTTISPTLDILSEATVSEDFPVEVGIYDLNKLLAAISLFKDPDLDFKEKYVIISENGSSIRYFYSDPALLNVKRKNIKMPKIVVSLSLSAAVLSEVQKAASVLQVQDFVIQSKEGSIYISALDKKDGSSNHFEVNLGSNTSGGEFKFYIRSSSLKLLPLNYKVDFAAGQVAQFKAEGSEITYWVVLETDSTWKSN